MENTQEQAVLTTLKSGKAKTEDAEETGISLSLALSHSCSLLPFIHLLLDIFQAWQA